MAKVEDAIRTLIQYHSKRIATGALRGLPAQVRAARREVRALRRSLERLTREVTELLVARRREKPVPPAPEDQMEKVRFTKRTPKSLRERFDLTQEELARLLQVSPVTITSWESGKSRPRKANLAQIVTLRGMSQPEVDAALGRPAAPAAIKPQQLKRLRRKLSLVQAQLAKLLGVSAASVTSWEAGKTEPGRENRRAIGELRKLSRGDADERLGRRAAATGQLGRRAKGALSPADIKAIRKKASLSQGKLAKLLKVSINSVSNWETGRSSPRRATVEKLVALRKGR